MAIPAGSTAITLTFQWKGRGEVSWDRMLVYTAPTSVTPVANQPASNSTTLTGATLRWTQPNASQSSYTAASVTLPNTLAGTTVRLIFTWQNDDQDGISPGAAIDNISLVYTPGTPVYCTAGATSTSFEKISNVTFNTINNNSTSTAGYENFTAVSTSINRGSSYQFTLTPSATWSGNQALVWIDFNADLDFNDSGELVYSSVVGGPYSGTIAIPSGATIGNTRMRVRLHDTSDTTPNATPCGNSSVGQVEDYTVNIAAALPALGCATLVSPANLATNVNPMLLTWTAPTTGPTPTSYDVYIGSTASNTAFVTNVATTSANITGWSPNTTYYWRIVSKSAAGSDSTGCEVRSFTTGNPFAPYCTANVIYTSATEPITLVNFAGINRASSNVIDGSPDLENYIADVANVTTESSYAITLKGNTNDDFSTYTNYFTVFIDWNQDGDFGDLNEAYPAGSITGSTGLDSDQAVTQIAVPYHALAGNTRMRVKKWYSTASSLDACTGGGYGQSEDYTVNVTKCQTQTAFFADTDSDGFGDSSSSVMACSAPAGYVSNSTDCNDGNNALYQMATFYIDVDGDGYDNGTASLCSGASVPAGHSATTNGMDCDDSNASVYQMATFFVDTDGDGYDNGTASLCSGASVPAGHSATTNGMDCDDNNASIYQMATFYVDADGDGYDNGTASLCSGASVPAGHSATTNGMDCNDANASIYQMATFYVDADGDGYDNGTASLCSGASVPAGHSATTNGMDCDDSNASVYQMATFYVDADGDGYDNGTASLCSGASVPAGHSATTNGTDCNDANSAVFQSSVLFVDADGDGYDNGTSLQCYGASVPAGFSASTNGTDCNDGDANAYQSAILYIDSDNDGYTNGNSTEVCYGASVPAGYVGSMTAIDCNDAVAAINPGHAEVLYNGVDDNCDGNLDEGFQVLSQVEIAQCGTTLASISSTISAVNFNNSTAYRFEVTNTTTNAVQTIDRPYRWFSLNLLSSYDYATTYSIRVQIQRNGVWLGYYGPSCLVSTPAVLAEGGAAQIATSQCGITLQAINSLIATNSIPNVTGYRFRVTNLTDDQGPNQIQTIDRPLHWFALTMLPRYNYGTQYMIEVSVKTNGVFSGYGSPCIVNSPVLVGLADCGNTIATSGSLVATTNRGNVTSYRFEITNLESNIVTTLDRPLHWFKFNMVPGYAPATQYGVRVALMTSGTYSPFGDACEITSPGAARPSDVREEAVAKTAFAAVAYPNPFAENFNIDVKTSAEEVIGVKLYDMTGRLLESREIEVSEIETLKVGDRYPSGVYNVIVTQGENVATLRVVKR